MESLKRVFLFVIIGLFLINFSSAGLFDPNSEIAFYEESKNGKYGYYEINDTDFWFFNNKPVKTIELIENEYSIFTAWNIKEYNIYRPTRLFDKTNYLDKTQSKDRSNLISSETHLYREWEVRTRTISSFECLEYDTILNGTNSTEVCSEYQDNSYEETYEEWSIWELYDFKTVQEGLYQTKTTVTRDRQGTGTIDWIDENEGYDLVEWAPWWDFDWLFKRPVSNLNTSISALYNITWVSGMKSDFSDLRFLDNATESIELNYTIVNKIDSSTAMIRINNLGENTVYMYYGNPSTTTTSSATSLYLNPSAGYFYDNVNSDDFVGSNDGAITGATFTANGRIGGAYSYDGTDYITVSNNAALNFGSSDFTIAFWVKYGQQSNGVQTMVQKGNVGAGGKRYGFANLENINSNFGKIHFDIDDDTLAKEIISSISTDDGLPHFVMGIRDGTDIKLYIDNVLRGTTAIGSYGSLDDTSKPLRIGATSYSAGDLIVADYIDELYLYPRALSLSERTSLFNQTEPNFIVGAEQSNLGVSTTLISPEDSQNILFNNVSFNYISTPTETNLTNTSLHIWNSTNSLISTNFTTLSGNTSVNITFINTLEDGIYKWNAETCGENVDCSFASSNNSFIVHVTPVTIDISEPSGTIEFITLGDNQTLSWQLSEPGENLTEHVVNCSYTYNSVITYLPLSTCVGTNTTEFEYVNTVNTLTFNVTDAFNLTSNSTTTWEYTIVELNQTFEQNITEGELDDFSLLLNISDSSSLDDATFSYNGTNYTTTIVFSEGLYLVESMIVSPVVDENTNFSFNFFFVVDGINYSTLVNQQLVLNSLFGVCGGISNDTLLNMSLFDEESGTSITGDIEIIADIVSQSSGVSVGEVNHTFSNVENGAICFTPESVYSLYFLNTEIKYTSDGYVSELYYIQNSDMSDYPRNLSLFSLNQTDSTEFVVTFQNDAFILVEGAVIQLQRKYIGEGVFKVVEAPITADGGKAIVHIDLNTNIYRISVVKDGVLLKFFSDVVFSCENELAGECTEQLRGDVDPNNDVPVEQLLDFAYSVTVSDENNTVNVLFAIPSGTPSTINVLLEQIDMFGNSTSCNTTVITSAGSITCDFSDTIEKSILQLTISKDGTQLAITNYGVDPELDMDGMNFFIVFLFLISLVGMAIASPEWMMIIGVMVFMISGTLLLLKGMSLAMGLGAMAWLVVVVIIIILKMAKQEDR